MKLDNIMNFTGLQTKQKRQLVLTPLCSLARVFYNTSIILMKFQDINKLLKLFKIAF